MKEKDVEKAKNKLQKEIGKQPANRREFRVWNVLQPKFKNIKRPIKNFLPTTEEHSGRRDEQRRAQRPAAE